MFCPSGCVCQAVRAPGVKCTLAAATREGSEGVATVSMKTAPVNQSPGPGVVWTSFLVICMAPPWLCPLTRFSGSARGTPPLGRDLDFVSFPTSGDSDVPLSLQAHDRCGGRGCRRRRCRDRQCGD